MTKTSPEQSTLIEHLSEIRMRLIRSLIVLFFVFLFFFYFSNELYHFLAQPLLKVLPDGIQMIATQVATPFTTPLKLSLFASFLIVLPYFLFEVWGFITPALFSHEKKKIFPLIFVSIILFYAGMSFAYFITFPVVFQFFTQTAPEGVQIATDISFYLDFVMGMLLSFGFSFQVPVVVWVLCWMGIVSPASLTEKRPYMIVAAFTVGMILTPPDVISQTLLSIPLYLLFELGIIMGKVYSKPINNDIEERQKIS